MMPPARNNSPARGAARLAATRLLVLSIGVPFVIFGLAAWYDRVSIEHQEQDNVVSTTDALAEHAQKVVETANLVLGRTLDRVRGMDWPAVGASRDVHDLLKQLDDELPQVESVFLVDKDGFNAASSRAFPIQAFDLRQREYYQAALAGEQGVHVSAPFAGLGQKALAFTISRARITNGQFDGVAAVTVSPRYFDSFYKSVMHTPDASTAALARSDGTLLLRYPPTTVAGGGRFRQSTPLHDAIASGALQGVYGAASAIDGRTRLTGFKRLEGTPLLVTYSVDTGAYLKQWYTHLIIFATFAVLASAALLVSARLALRGAAQEQTGLRLLLEETGRRQRAEAALQQSQKMEALGRLTGGVAHDFNNLLAAILGSVELVRRRAADDRSKRLLDNAAEAARRGAKLTAQMLAFSRRHEMAMQSVAVNVVIQRIGDLLEQTAGGAPMLRYDLEEQLWPAVADTVQLELALLNLVANAHDAMPNGGEIVIRTRNIPGDTGTDPTDKSAAGKFVLLSVSDSGEGMPQDVAARAFEPFFTTKGPGKGTGLGLSMVYGFATQAGGRATIESAPGKGTTITLYLQRANAQPAAEAENDGKIQQTGRLRLLLVDDDDQVRILTREMLLELGHDVTDVSNGPAALALLRSGRGFDMLVADFAMPVMDGSQLAAEAVRVVPGLAVLFLTGYAANDALKFWSDLGYRIVRKPFEIGELSAGIAAAAGSPPDRENVVPLRAP